MRHIAPLIVALVLTAAPAWAQSVDPATGPTSTPDDLGSIVPDASGTPGPDPECGMRALDPLPRPRDPSAMDFWRAFRAPLPPAPLWNPPGQKHVGLQAGHWLTEQAPPELGRLQQGSFGGGKAEWEVNLDLATRTAAILEDVGVDVDVLPATVPPGYLAHAFVAIHADGDPAGQLRGFKIARPGFAAIPDYDDQLVSDLYQAYASVTGLPRDDDHISRRMLYYYAFNSRRYCHSVAPGVPQAIVETGFLTSAADRDILLGNPQASALGLADGILAFLNEPRS